MDERRGTRGRRGEKVREGNKQGRGRTTEVRRLSEMRCHFNLQMRITATNRMGMKGSTVINRPKARLPSMAPIRPKAALMPKAVELRRVGKRGRSHRCTVTNIQALTEGGKERVRLS